MKVMTAQEVALSYGIKAWFAGGVAAVLFLFFWGFVAAILEPKGLTLGSLLAGLFLSVVQFTVIAIFTAIPASLFMWIAHKLRLEFLVIFAGFGAALGWSGNLIFWPINARSFWPLVIAGTIAGTAAWYFKRTTGSALQI